jgi:hypothetical protein
MSEPLISVQRYSLGLDSKGRPQLVYDMQGAVVRFPDHLKALNTDRALAKLDAEEAADKCGEVAAPDTTPLPSNVHAFHRALKDAIKGLRDLGWSDGDITFAGELTPGPLKSIVDLQPDPSGEVPGREGDSAARRERAVNDLLEIATLADDDVMRAELEGLASRFSYSPANPSGTTRGEQ